MILVTAIINFKCGIAKTTTTMNLWADLSKLKERVLVIDTEPQGNINNFNAIVGTKKQENDISNSGYKF